MTDFPDWYKAIIVSGKYNSTFIPLAVDANGNLLGVLQGDYGGTPKTIAVDSNGYMLANLIAQDLAFQKVRPAYAQVLRANGSQNITAGNTVSIVTVSGQGITLGGSLVYGFASTATLVACRIYTDTAKIDDHTATYLNAQHWYTHGQQPLYLQKYDDTNFAYSVGISPGITFETSLELEAYNPYGYDVTIVYHLFYSLVP